VCFNKTKYTKLVFHLLLFYKCLGFAWLRIFCFVCLDGKIAVTAVDSGIRALQFLGLDEQRRTSESDGFVVCITRIFISLYFHEILFSIAYFSALCFFFPTSIAGFEGGSNYHRLLHARNDRLRVAQENQG